MAGEQKKQVWKDFWTFHEQLNFLAIRTTRSPKDKGNRSKINFEAAACLWEIKDINVFSESASADAAFCVRRGSFNDLQEMLELSDACYASH